MPRNQKSLNKVQQRALRWGSHLPLNIAVMKSFPVTGVMELGAGLNSTPVFFNNCDEVVSIEADEDWITKLREEQLVAETDNHRLVHHKLPVGIARGTLRNQIAGVVLLAAVDFYRKHWNSRLNYLFVDCYAGLRLAALDGLHRDFDIVAYHDANAAFDKNYSYSEFIASDEYIRFLDKTFLSHTGLLVKRTLESRLDTFFANYADAAKDYAAKFDVRFKPKLVRLSPD